MAKIDNDDVYHSIMERIEQLVPCDTRPTLSKAEHDELCLLADLVVEYEEEHYPMVRPSLKEYLEYRMTERDLSPSAMAQLLAMDPQRMTALLDGSCRPSPTEAQTLCDKLDIPLEVSLAD